MALPTSENEVTVRRLSSTLQGLWNKIRTALGTKADKVSNATSGNFAVLDGNGNLTDSCHKHSDYATAAQGNKADSAIQGVIAGETTITPDGNKVVTINKNDLGLGNVTNDAQVKRSEMGVANGVATLDSDGLVPASQLPSYVDDVVEGYYYNGSFYSDAAHTQAVTPSAGKIYCDVETNISYRWGGSQYVKMASDIALGETSSTAYRGDRGKTAYDHSQVTSGNPHNVTKSEVGLGNVDNTSDATKKTNFTGSIASGNTGFATGGDVYTELAKKQGNLAFNGTYNASTNKVATESTVSNATSGKADMVANATSGNLAGLDSNGNLTDSGKSVQTSSSTWDGTSDAKVPTLAAVQAELDKKADNTDTTDKEEVVAAALDDLDARLQSVESSLDETNLGERTADRLDVQNLKVRGVDIGDLLDGKVDKVSGKGLSQNDFTNSYKEQVDANTTARHTHSNKSVLDGISSTDVSNWNAKQSSLTWMTDEEVDYMWNAAKAAAVS